MEATRQIYWNIGGESLTHVIALAALVIFGVGFYQKIRIWQKGRADNYNDLGLRLKQLGADVFKHDEKVFKGSFRRFMHMGIFYGFLVLLIGTIMIALQEYLHIPLYQGTSYLIISLLMDLFGLAAVIGIVMAAYKRYIDKPDHSEYTWDDAVLLILIFAILVTGFVVEGLRIYCTRDPWAGWTPVGYLSSIIFQAAGVSIPAAEKVHAWLWYVHMLLAFGFIAYIPYSKLFHMIASPLNLMLKSSPHIGGLTPSDNLNMTVQEDTDQRAFELEDFTRKQLLELNACVSCLRCEKGCPAYMSGAPLSPRQIVKDLKLYACQKTPVFNCRNSDAPSLSLPVIPAETLWSCTTCGLCEDKCPVNLEHIRRIVDLRRGLVNQVKGCPPEVEQVFSNISAKGNPWGINLQGQADLPNLNRAPLISEKKETDILYWTGCFGSYNSRNRRFLQVMFEILKIAGVDYAILGDEEKCCGDSVRRLGNERLFQQLAAENINTLNQYRFKTIVTHCPHCYNVLKNEYPKFGGQYRVLHHSEFILELIRSGQIRLKEKAKIRVTYHDPCYLGRYNMIYDAPREVLASIQGLELAEMKNNRVRAFCCGAGGGRFWIKNSYREKINDILVGKAKKTKAAVLVSACPLCLTSLSEAVEGLETDMTTMDIAEVVYSAIE